MTVTLTLKAEPSQTPDVGVTEYTAVTGVVVLLMSVPLISLCPDAEVPPEKPLPVGVFHLYVVPVGIAPPGV